MYEFGFVRRDCLVRTGSFFVITRKKSPNLKYETQNLVNFLLVRNGFHKNSQQDPALKQNRGGLKGLLICRVEFPIAVPSWRLAILVTSPLSIYNFRQQPSIEPNNPSFINRMSLRK